MLKFLVILIVYIAIKNVVGLKCYYAPADTEISAIGDEVLTCDPNEIDKFLQFSPNNKDPNREIHCFTIIIKRDGNHYKMHKGCTWSGGCDATMVKWNEEKSKYNSANLNATCFECGDDKCNSQSGAAALKLITNFLCVMSTMIYLLNVVDG